ncbi:MAG: siderophore-interacting protein [Sporichthyaceae bacterium]
MRETRRISRSMLRVEFDGEGLTGFDPAGWTDAYINASFPPADFPLAIPFDPNEAKALPAEQRPAARRYSVRHWDPEAGVLTLDFVVHGDSGVAGPWALRAQPGDLLQFNPPSGGYRPDPAADWHLMVGDESALPAIGASLAVLPADATVYAFLEVDGDEDHLELPTDATLHLRWLHRQAPGNLLLEALKSFARPAGRVHAFVHGEAVDNRELRRYLLTDWAIPRADISVSPYWRRGDTDESWRKIRKAWLADVEHDV